MADLQPLVERYVADPTPVHREAAVLAGVPLVRSLVGKVSVPDHPLAGLDDLEGAGLVGLVEALDKYDPGAGASFMTFAYLRVRGAIVDYLRSLDVLSNEKRKQVGVAAATADALRQELGAEPTDREVAARMDLDLTAYDRLMAEAQTRFALSLDAPTAGEDTASLYDLLPDAEGGSAFADAEQDDTLAAVRQAILGLPSRTRAMVGMYYDEELTLRQIGEVFQVSEARVSQILGKTMLQLRASVGAVAVACPPRSTGGGRPPARGGPGAPLSRPEARAR